MTGANGTAQVESDSPSIRFRGRSFVLAGDLSRDEQRALEREIEARGGSVHPYLNAMTDVLVVGRAEGNEAGAQWAREQIRRGGIYRVRWEHLELVDRGRAAGRDQGEPGGAGFRCLRRSAPAPGLMYAFVTPRRRPSGRNLVFLHSPCWKKPASRAAWEGRHSNAEVGVRPAGRLPEKGTLMTPRAERPRGGRASPGTPSQSAPSMSPGGLLARTTRTKNLRRSLTSSSPRSLTSSASPFRKTGRVLAHSSVFTSDLQRSDPQP